VYLGIDTATPFLALALWSAAGTRASYQRELGRAHGSHIMTALAQLFADADCQPAEIKAIGVGLGPGSYTGVRVGIASALGLARGWGCPVVGESTLAALAARYLEQHPATKQVTAALDARRDNVYAATFTIKQTPNNQTPNSAGITGDVEVAEVVKDRLRLHLQNDIQKIPRTDLSGEIAEGIAPSALYLAKYACEHTGDAGQLEPYYL
jgi:tRNA threonylcarbamoyl adenosine modification protein YeaZ